MIAWCEAADVELYLGSVTGRNFDESHIETNIGSARDRIIERLAGKFPTETLDAWDAALDAVPPSIRRITAKLAAAYLLEGFADGQSTADVTSCAGGYYRDCTQSLDDIKRNSASVVTSQADSAPVSKASALIYSTTETADKTFTRDSLENF